MLVQYRVAAEQAAAAARRERPPARPALRCPYYCNNWMDRIQVHFYFLEGMRRAMNTFQRNNMSLSKKPKLLPSLIMLQASVQAFMEPFQSIPIVSNLPSDSQFLVGTHDGSFHCDEALALSMLQLHPTYQNKFTIVRTRNPAILSVRKCFLGSCLCSC